MHSKTTRYKNKHNSQDHQYNQSSIKNSRRTASSIKNSRRTASSRHLYIQLFLWSTCHLNNPTRAASLPAQVRQVVWSRGDIRSGAKGRRSAAEHRPIGKAVKEAYNPRWTRGEPSEHKRDNTITSRAKLSNFYPLHYTTKMRIHYL